jgi:hypothetical protein
MQGGCTPLDLLRSSGRDEMGRRLIALLDPVLRPPPPDVVPKPRHLTTPQLEAMLKGVAEWGALRGGRLITGMKGMLVAAGVPGAGDIPALTSAEMEATHLPFRRVVNKLLLPIQHALRASVDADSRYAANSVHFICWGRPTPNCQLCSSTAHVRLQVVEAITKILNEEDVRRKSG